MQPHSKQIGCIRKLFEIKDRYDYNYVKAMLSIFG